MQPQVESLHMYKGNLALKVMDATSEVQTLLSLAFGKACFADTGL